MKLRSPFLVLKLKAKLLLPSLINVAGLSKGLKWSKPFMIYVSIQCLQWFFLPNRVKVFSSLWAICCCVIANMKGILRNLCTPRLSIGRQYRPICQLTCRPSIGLLLIAILADMSIDMLADTWPHVDRPICRPIHRLTLGQYRKCQMSVEYCSTVGGISVNYQWHIGWLWLV